MYSVSLFLILIISPHCLEAMTWNLYRNAPSCCQSYQVTAAPVKCVPCPPTTTLPPKIVKPVSELCCGAYEVAKPCKPCVPVYPVKEVTTPAPPLYTPSPCLPPTCYTDLVKQKVEIENIYKQGSQMMVDYSDSATGPVVYVAQTISNGADLIPTLFAAGGGFLGKAIAAPIQFFNRIGFSFLSGAISQVVTIPISLGTSVRASTVVLQPYLRWFGLGGKDAPHTCCATPPTPGTFEQIGLKPVGILTGPVHLALGSFLSLGGSTFRLIGTLTKSGGEFFENTGHGFKNVGALKVADGIKSVSSFLSKVDNPQSQTICIDDGKKLSFYEKVPVIATTPIPVYSTTVAPYTTTVEPYTKVEVVKPVIKPVVTTPYPVVASTTVKMVPKYSTTPPPTTTTTTLAPSYEVTTSKVVAVAKPEIPVYPDLPILNESEYDAGPEDDDEKEDK